MAAHNGTWVLVRLSFIGLMLAVLVSGLCSRSVWAGEKTIVLQEHLNRRWAHQLVTYPFEGAKGECALESVSLAGPNGPLPVQLSDVVLWPGTESVKSARLSFIVEELRPLATQTYTVSYGSEPAAGGTVASDLKIAAGREQVEITTSRFGVRLLLGEKAYEDPVPSGKVPGPILAMRLSDGTWFGGSRLYGDSPVKSWASRLTAGGPVFARVETTYTYANGNVLKVTCQLAAGDYAALIDMDVAQDQRDDGWELLLAGGVKIGDVVRIAGRARPYARETTVRLAPSSQAPVCYLSPCMTVGWFVDSPGVIRLKLAEKAGELQLTARDVGAWVEPQKRPFWANFARWYDGVVGHLWSGWTSKRIPLFSTPDGGALMHMSLAAGERKWTLGHAEDGQRLAESFSRKAMTAHAAVPTLDEVKDMALDWKDTPHKRPYLFVTPQEFEAAASGNRAVYDELRNVEALRTALDRLGNLDLMRQLMEVASRYDAIIDSGLLTPQERKLFKAQMAYLAYETASPRHWSVERGYMSGNPNMSVARITNLGILGMAMPDHPLGARWAQYAVEWVNFWLTETVDEGGSWPESSHYARVSWSEIVQFAVAARNCGVHDFFTHPGFRRMAEFYEKTLTPPDPLRLSGPMVPVRAGAPYGRGTRGDVWGISAAIARATAQSDPAFSRIMQWSWQQCGFTEHLGHSTAGAISLYVNPRLPTALPDWRSEYLPNLGYLLRSHLGTPHENYLLFVSHYFRSPDGEIWPPDTGIISKWFANGRPIGGVFRRIPSTSHVLLENRVLLACNWDPSVGKSPPTGYVTKTSQDAFSSLPGLDYVSVGFEVPKIAPHHLKMPQDAPAFPKRNRVGQPPFHWQRQLMLFNSEKPGGVNYLLLRDSVSGGQPTQWHFWTLSEKIGTPQQAADRDAFLKDKPGANVAPLRRLEGDRFTALGQFDMDLEYYIASPTGTPRYTLRYGTRGGAYGLRNFDEFQDLMHLQLEGDGCYYVAMFPRFRNEEAPRFAALADGKVIKVAGTFGTDYGFLSRERAEAKAERASFNGTAGAVQDRASGLALVLAAPGRVTYGEYGLSAQMPVTLRISPYALTLELPEDSPGGEIALQMPGKWSLARGQGGVKPAEEANRYALTIPAGTRTVRLIRTP